jgi:hypothetical protein
MNESDVADLKWIFNVENKSSVRRIIFQKILNFFFKNEMTINARNFGNLTRQSRFLNAEVFNK